MKMNFLSPENYENSFIIIEPHLHTSGNRVQLNPNHDSAVSCHLDCFLRKHAVVGEPSNFDRKNVIDVIYQQKEQTWTSTEPCGRVGSTPSEIKQHSLNATN